MPKKYEEYTVPELKEVAKKRGLVGYSRMRKADLIGMLRAKSSNNDQYSPISGPDFHRKGVFIFTKNGCGYCSKAKELLTSKGIKYGQCEVTNTNKDMIYTETDKYTNKYRMFPMVFIDGKFIGGYQELSKLHM
jgi:glutaredoxin